MLADEVASLLVRDLVYHIGVWLTVLTPALAGLSVLALRMIFHNVEVRVVDCVILFDHICVVSDVLRLLLAFGLSHDH